MTTTAARSEDAGQVGPEPGAGPDRLSAVTRRRFLAGIAGTMGLAGAASVAAWAGGLFDLGPRLIAPDDPIVARVEAGRVRASAATVAASLNPRPVTVDLGGPIVQTWGYAESVPGPLIRARAGDLIRATVINGLPTDTSVHWHGVALRNDMDGVPGVTQAPIATGGRHTYAFTVPDPGTYFFHPHSGVQLDRALYGVLIVDDPYEAGRYDAEWIVVLDDWLDDTGRTPDQVLADLQSMTGMHGGGMEMMNSPLLGGAGDVAYPHYLINGRVSTAPVTLTGKPGQRVRMRLVNAASDTAFRIALGGHRLAITHTDGFAVTATAVDALLLGMGERADVLVDLADGVFPLVAAAEGKNGQALAVVRTGPGSLPAATTRPAELDRQVINTATLRAADATGLPGRDPDVVHRLELGGGMMSYRWTINGATFDRSEPLIVHHGERVRLAFVNRTMMFHPMHVHGHTFALTGGGARKDTVIVLPHQRITVDLDALNPGQWVTHCHNTYHAETGMMINLAYAV